MWGEVQQIHLIVNHGVELAMLLFNEGLVPLFYANARIMSLILAWSAITTIYPFHNLVSCLITSRGSLACVDTMYDKHSNITHTILTLDQTIQAFAANVTSEASNRVQSFAADVKHGAITRVNARINGTFLDAVKK